MVSGKKNMLVFTDTHSQHIGTSHEDQRLKPKVFVSRKETSFSKASNFWSILFFQDVSLRISFCFASSTLFCHLRFSDFCSNTEFFILKFFSPPRIPTVTADFLDSWKYWRFNFYALDFTHHAFRLLQKGRWFFLQRLG